MYPFVDGHCDTITRLADRRAELLQNDGQIDLGRLWQSGCALQVFAVWLDPYYYASPLRQTLKYLDYYFGQLEENRLEMGHVNTKADLDRHLRAGKVSTLLSLEGGEALEGELGVLRMLFQLGVRGLTLTWNNRNQLGEPASHGASAGGLTEFGKAVVREMNRLGMLVDVSHLSEAGFWDVARLAKAPFIASHSNAKAICPSGRNLTDDQIRAVADSGGVIGLNLYSSFLTQDGPADSSHLLRHAAHILEVGGEDVLGFGCDFDGIDTPPTDVPDVAALPQVFAQMEAEFGKEVTEKMTHKNFLRVLGAVLPEA